MTAETCGRARGLACGVLGLVLAALLADDCAAQAAPIVPGASQRVALVIGNSRYPAEPLPSAARDAAAVAEKLRGMGYSVRSLNDLTKEQMQAAYRQHVQDLVASGGVGVIYFAGHGLQFDGQTFLVPIDAETGDRREAGFWAVALDPMLLILERAGNRANVVLLDACRNNPFGRTEGRTPGLAAPTLANLKSTLVQYATAPGLKALDGGKDKHSPYAEALLSQLDMPSDDVTEMLRRVRESVMAATRNEQTPWEVGTLRERISLQAPAGTAAPAPPRAVAAAASGGTGAGAGILRYLGQDRGAARFAKVREVMATDFGRQPISGDEFVGILQGLTGQQLVSVMHMFLKNVDEDLSARQVLSVVAMTTAEDRLAAVAGLVRRLKGTLSVADALVILDGESPRLRQSILFSLRDKLPPNLSGTEVLRLSGDPRPDSRATLDALAPRVEHLTPSELQALVAPLLGRERAHALEKLSPKVVGELSAQQAGELLDNETGSSREQLLKLLAPHVASGLSDAQAQALLGTLDGSQRAAAASLLKPKLNAPAVASAAAPVQREAPAAAPVEASKKSKADAAVAAAPAVPSAPPVSKQVAAAAPVVANVAPKAPPQIAPPVGEYLILSEPQVRYCLYEKERLLTLRSLLGPGDAGPRAQFDMRATDYRSRCTHYRFVRGLDAKIAAEIVDQRPSLNREAMAILGRNR